MHILGEATGGRRRALRHRRHGFTLLFFLSRPIVNSHHSRRYDCLRPMDGSLVRTRRQAATEFPWHFTSLERLDVAVSYSSFSCRKSFYSGPVESWTGFQNHMESSSRRQKAIAIAKRYREERASMRRPAHPAETAKSAPRHPLCPAMREFAAGAREAMRGLRCGSL